MADNQTAFSKQAILAKQELAREEYDKRMEEMRKAFEDVAGTPSGEKVFQYLFLLCGGDAGSVRRGKDGVIDTNETLLTLGAKSVYDNVRFNLSSETLKKVERHSWELVK